MQIRQHTTSYRTSIDTSAKITPSGSDQWKWSFNSFFGETNLYASRFSLLKDESDLPATPYRFKSCTHASQEHDYTFDHRFNINVAADFDDRSVGTFVTSSGLPELFSDANTVTAYELARNMANPVDWQKLSLSDIESWYGDKRIPGGITIDRDAIRSDFSIWYLLVDIKDLLLGFGLWIPQLRKLRGHWSTSRKGLTAKAIVDGHLQYQFGLTPTWNDIVGFIDAFKKLADATEELKRVAKTVHRYRVKPITLSGKRVYTSETQTAIPGGLIVPVRQTIEITQPRLWHGTCMYTYKCEEFSGLLSRIKYAVDTFGVLDAAAAWDVIPWSFVVDWFVDIGGWLHDHSPKLYPVDVHVKDYCESLKQTVVVTSKAGNCWLALRGDIPTGEPRGHFVGFPAKGMDGGLQFARSSYTYFTRRRFIPNVRMGARGLSLRNFNFRFRRMAIATSLIAQRVPRAKSWSDDFDILEDIVFGDRVNIRPLGRPKAKSLPSGGIRQGGTRPRPKA